MRALGITAQQYLLASCYNKCVKLFFGYDRRYSVTQMLLELGLPCFKTVVHNGRLLLHNARLSSENFIVNHLCSLGIG
jgi:hypothetical protein